MHYTLHVRVARQFAAVNLYRIDACVALVTNVLIDPHIRLSIVPIINNIKKHLQNNSIMPLTTITTKKILYSNRKYLTVYYNAFDIAFITCAVLTAV